MPSRRHARCDVISRSDSSPAANTPGATRGSARPGWCRSAACHDEDRHVGRIAACVRRRPPGVVHVDQRIDEPAWRRGQSERAASRSRPCKAGTLRRSASTLPHPAQHETRAANASGLWPECSIRSTSNRSASNAQLWRRRACKVTTAGGSSGGRRRSSNAAASSFLSSAERIRDSTISAYWQFGRSPANGPALLGLRDLALAAKVRVAQNTEQRRRRLHAAPNAAFSVFSARSFLLALISGRRRPAAPCWSGARVPRGVRLDDARHVPRRVAAIRPQPVRRRRLRREPHQLLGRLA